MAGTIDDLVGLLAGKITKPITIEEMNEGAAAGWAGEEELKTRHECNLMQINAIFCKTVQFNANPLLFWRFCIKLH